MIIGGNAKLQRAVAVLLPASMEPPMIIGGNINPANWQTIVLSASMEPPMIVGGNCRSRRMGCRAASLQWSRR